MRYEKKYDVSSEIFIEKWSADDLEGKDVEYIEWAGEYELALRLKDHIETLESIEYAS